MLCKKCNKEFTPKKGARNYCSVSCANSRTFSVESRIKKSIKTKRARNRGDYDHLNMKVINNDKEKIDKSTQTWVINYEKKRGEGYLHSWDTIRKYHFIKQNHTCQVCGLSEWMGKQIPLELHHIDGRRNNNHDDNLQVICPNCHSQTDNYCGKNINDRHPVDINEREELGTKIELFTYKEILEDWKNCVIKPKGYHRKRDYLSNKYKLSAGTIGKLIYIYKKGPLYIEMLDSDSDLSINIVYKLLHETNEDLHKYFEE